ncbi:MAG TPA: YncE family protein [Longimicrobiales bacterium]
MHRQRLEAEGVAVELTVSGRDGNAKHLVERRDAVVHVALRDAKTGAPLTDLQPFAWIDLQAGGEPLAGQTCRDQVQAYLQGRLYPEGSLTGHADVDLNTFYLVTLNRGGTIAVIDPITGFGRTKLYTTVRLESSGQDWTADADDRRLFVTMPRVGKVAVVDTDSWDVIATVEAGVAPMRIAFQPGGKYLWVTNHGTGDDAGVTVIDAESLEVVASIPTGAAPVALVFTPDGERAFVANRDAGTVSVIDAVERVKLRDFTLGPRPVDLAYSPADGAVYVIDEGQGTLVGLDAESLEVLGGIPFEPGLSMVAFAPAGTQGPHTPFPAPSPPPDGGEGASQAHPHHPGGGEGTDEPRAGEATPGHAHHPGGGGRGEVHERPAAGAPAQAHHAAPAAGPGRYAFITNPVASRVHVFDVLTRQVVRSDSIGVNPDRVYFTQTFAYIRSAGSAEVALIPLADPTRGGTGHLDKFLAGQRAPLEAGAPGPGDAIVPSPVMHDAIFVMNPKERMVYYYHYMEGMPIPSGGLTTYGFEPHAIRIVQKGLKEVKPGEYRATVKLPEPGDYQLVLLIDEPRIVHCFDPMQVLADSDLREGRVALRAEPLVETRTLRPGSNVVRFELRDDFTGKPLRGLDDVAIVVASPTGGRAVAGGKGVRGQAGVYEFEIEVRPASVYYVSFQIPSIGVYPRTQSPVIFRGRAAQGE